MSLFAGGRLERFGSGRFHYKMKNCQGTMLLVGMCAMCEAGRQAGRQAGREGGREGGREAERGQVVDNALYVCDWCVVDMCVTYVGMCS